MRAPRCDRWHSGEGLDAKHGEAALSPITFSVASSLWVWVSRRSGVE